MIILGVTGGHDANWCIVQDGVLLGAFEKERFSRVRHAAGEVLPWLVQTLARLGLQVSDIDMVATSEPVHRGTGSGLRRLAGQTYTSIDTWEHHVVELFGHILPCVSIPHHLAHAAYAHYTSGRSESAVISWDGGGDFYTEDAYCSTAVSAWRDSRLQWIERVPNSDFGSLWFTYARAVFGDPNQAGKLMGLAALGSAERDQDIFDRYAYEQRGVFAGAITVKNCWPDYDSPPFVKDRLTWSDPEARNLAHAVQGLTTSAGLSLSKTVRSVVGIPHLALAGGVALNGYLNTAIRKSGHFDEVSIPPAVDDGGLSVGCALFVSHHILGGGLDLDSAKDWASVGMWHDREEILTALQDEPRVVFEEIGTGDAVEHAALEIAAGRPIAWFAGRAEHGPRALGSRSILSPASREEHRGHINADVKFREAFRPVAPLTTDELAPLYFDVDGGSPYMMYIVNCTSRAELEVPAVVHVDSTARVQTVPGDSLLGRMVGRLPALGHPPVLVNTSFNVQEPIVNSPGQAIESYLRSPITSMYLDGFLVRKVK